MNGIKILKKDSFYILRHRMKHHFYYSFSWGDVVIHQPFSCHPHTSVAV